MADEFPLEGEFLDIIIFYSHPDSSINMDDIVNNQSYSSNYVAISVSTYEELIEALRNIPSTANNVFLYLHSGTGEKNGAYCFMFYHAKYYYNDDISSDFPEINIHGNIYLFSCHGAYLALCIAKKQGKMLLQRDRVSALLEMAAPGVDFLAYFYQLNIVKQSVGLCILQQAWNTKILGLFMRMLFVSCFISLKIFFQNRRYKVV